jgi:hypothetical protein
MKIALRVLGAVVALGILWWAVQLVAAESGEVVVLTTADATGAEHGTRLWIVDHDDAGWLRAGGDIAGWYRRLSAQPEITVERGEQARAYLAQPDPTQRETINRLMLEKYGWAESYIGFFIDRGGSIPIRLVRPEG